MLVAAWLAAGAPALAQDPLADGFSHEIVVTPLRGPQDPDAVAARVTVLDRTRIEQLAARDLGELLEQVPGLQVLLAGASGAPPILAARGFFGGGEAEYVKLVVDGVPAGDLDSGRVDWRRLRAGEIERIEVVTGPAAASYGDAALGAVVQVFRRPAGEGSQLTVLLGEPREGGFEASLGGRRGPYALRLESSASSTAGSRDHSGARRLALAGSVQRGLPSGTLRLTAEASAAGRDEPGALPLETWRARPEDSDEIHAHDGERRTEGTLALALERAGAGGGLRASASARLSGSERDRTLLLAPGFGDGARSEVSGLALDLRVAGHRGCSLGRSRLELRGGADLAREALSVDDSPLAGGRAGALRGRLSGQRLRGALFASGTLSLPARLNLEAGLRLDAISDRFPAGRDHGAASPRLAVSLRLGSGAEAATIHLQAARAFQAPTLGQLFDPRPFPGPEGRPLYLSNRGLEPQRATSLEAGLRGRRGGVSLAALLYRMDLRDEIDFDPASFSYGNIGRSRHRGIELDAGWSAGALELGLDYAYGEVESMREGGRGRQLKNVPRHALRALVTARLPRGLRLFARGSWLGGRYLDDANLLALDDLVQGELGAQFAAGRLRLQLGLRGIGRRAPAYGFALPTLEGGSAAYVFPGAGREIRLGVTFELGSAARAASGGQPPVKKRATAGRQALPSATASAHPTARQGREAPPRTPSFLHGLLDARP